MKRGENDNQCYESYNRARGMFTRKEGTQRLFGPKTTRWNHVVEASVNWSDAVGRERINAKTSPHTKKKKKKKKNHTPKKKKKIQRMPGGRETYRAIPSILPEMAVRRGRDMRFT